jgi:polyphosphate kinase 2
MIKGFINYINEGYISNIPHDNVDTIKYELIDFLDEFRDGILKSIKYDTKSQKVTSVKNIDIPKVIDDLKEEFDSDFIDELNIDAFLRKIYQILELKKRNTKKIIKDEFIDYYISLDRRLSKDTVGDDINKYDEFEGEGSLISGKKYEKEKFDLQVELLKMQEWVMKTGARVAIVFEGRDAAGKGSTISRFTEYLNPKGFKVVALGVPTAEERKDWLGRYEKYLPTDGQIVFFDRSWYNRAVVEPAMGYCSEEEYSNFMNTVVDWEEDQIKNGLILIKIWFSISKEKQLLRFEFRKTSPLKYWKFSPNDAKVISKWDVISNYKNQMFSRTSSIKSPWVIVNSNDKKIGRLNAMRYVLNAIDYDDKNDDLVRYYPEVVSVLK